MYRSLLLLSNSNCFIVANKHDLILSYLILKDIGCNILIRKRFQFEFNYSYCKIDGRLICVNRISFSAFETQSVIHSSSSNT